MRRPIRLLKRNIESLEEQLRYEEKYLEENHDDEEQMRGRILYTRNLIDCINRTQLNKSGPLTLNMNLQKKFLSLDVKELAAVIRQLFEEQYQSQGSYKIVTFGSLEKRRVPFTIEKQLYTKEIQIHPAIYFAIGSSKNLKLYQPLHQKFCDIVMNPNLFKEQPIPKDFVLLKADLPQGKGPFLNISHTESKQGEITSRESKRVFDETYQEFGLPVAREVYRFQAKKRIFLPTEQGYKLNMRTGVDPKMIVSSFLSLLLTDLAQHDLQEDVPEETYQHVFRDVYGKYPGGKERTIKENAEKEIPKVLKYVPREKIMIK